MLGNAAAAYAIALVLLSFYAATGLLGDMPLIVAAGVFALGSVLSLCVFAYLRGRHRALCGLSYNLLLAGLTTLSWPVARDVALTIRQTAAASFSVFPRQELLLTTLWIASAVLLAWHAWLFVTWPVRTRNRRATRPALPAVSRSE